MDGGVSEDRSLIPVYIFSEKGLTAIIIAKIKP